MKRWVLAAVATGSITMWVAAPARANDNDYFDYLKKTNAYLFSQYTNQQLLAEGHKVCDAIAGGATDDAAADMVKGDLSVSDDAALDVYHAATVEMGC
jgi:tryptophanase